MHDSSPRQKTPPPHLAAIAAHVCEHGPIPGCQHIFEQLIKLDAEFPGLLFRDFVVACAIASAEGEA
jgi:hypothetical protein